MTIHIVGAGAIGGLVGAYLHEAGHEVVLVDANAEHVAAINARGLQISGEADFTAYPRAVRPEHLTGPLDTVLLAVKSRHTQDALKTIAPLLSDDGFVVSLQNGLEEYPIADAVGPQRTVGALVTFGGFYDKPGHLIYGGAGTFRIGEVDGTESNRVHELAALLSEFHPTEVTSNIFGYLWSKAAIAAVYFATAVANEDVPVLLAKNQHRSLFGRLVGEVERVAQAAGVRCETVDGFDPTLFTVDAEADPAQVESAWQAQIAYWVAHQQTRTGVWRDLAIHRRPTEVDHILGPVLDLAAKHGVEVPHVRAVTDAVHRAEKDPDTMGEHVLAELAEVR
ncbi:ketopantoate reductase family protein [Amycolatopsis jejuensis]|uniref:ketopantoate reductase family protein n=1 Tax=Amycolatopsis jejuensis TaxID=330084 RepID=UPI000523F62B|nr:ketopantoate reductase family protein [Amycolatopsis jejuensis]